jgi:hypothetical protein
MVVVELLPAAAAPADAAAGTTLALLLSVRACRHNKVQAD